MYEIIDALEAFVKSLLAMLVSEIRDVRIFDLGDTLDFLSRISVRVGEKKAKLFDEIEKIARRLRTENERDFVSRVCFSEGWGEHIKVGTKSTFQLRKPFAVMLGCDDWDYPEEADEYDSLKGLTFDIAHMMYIMMRDRTGYTYGEFEKARKFFKYEGKIQFIKLVRELTQDMKAPNEEGELRCVVGLKDAKEFTEMAFDEVREDITVLKSELRDILEKHVTVW